MYYLIYRLKDAQLHSINIPVQGCTLTPVSSLPHVRVMLLVRKGSSPIFAYKGGKVLEI